MQPLTGMLVVDFTRYLPGAYASRELSGSARASCGSSRRRAIRCARPRPHGTPRFAPASESVVCDLPHDARVRAGAVRERDVVLEGFRPGVAARLGVGPDRGLPDGGLLLDHRLRDDGAGTRCEPATTSTTSAGRASSRTRRPALPPVQVADLAAGALGAVTQVLAALLERARTGRGRHVVVSMTHGSHGLVAHRLGGEPCRGC